ncbi:hypothetical protein SELMODRAFT_429772 [Selaginella moellendorffii]|uniref:Uncharacterized protein n=1 Tax=Selaginella moellendorffii TaxID=88036 RepID=D8T790_SELML|nr:taxadiene 5-alpha hydroxylase [Selaginella moellendorffii]EFJ07576.1 hypothetical protein SELMODRAFT_429772 [Selaginella moellendorffii]|eukprot:XP_002991464.1 taxadiene 5-alpha hydroxylase [Selaginella moellendorffii]
MEVDLEEIRHPLSERCYICSIPSRGKYGPVFKTHLFGLPTVMVTSTDGLKLIFTNQSKIVHGSWPSSVKKLVGERSLFFRPFRHILIALLGPEALQRYVGRIAMIQKHVEESWIAGGEIKAYHSVKEALYAVIYDLFLSLTDEKEQQELLDPFRVVLHALIELPLDFPATAFSKGMAGRQEIMTKLDRMMEQRRLDLQSGKASSRLSSKISCRCCWSRWATHDRRGDQAKHLDAGYWNP